MKILERIIFPLKRIDEKSLFFVGNKKRLIIIGCLPQYSPEVFSKAMGQVENFEENGQK